MSSTERCGDDTLVAVAAGHLVARLDLALHGHEDLDHLHDARRKLVAALQLLDLVEEAVFEALLRLFVLLLHGFEFAHGLLVGKRDVPPLRRGMSSSVFAVISPSILWPFGPPVAALPVRKRLRRP
jgi:hypothetical protein